MSKIDDVKNLYNELHLKGESIQVTNNYNKIENLVDGKIMAVYLDKDSLSPSNPSKDEIGLYIKFGGRTFKVALEEI